jgi:hypothetical protein
MTKYISVADSYSIYEVEDEAFELLPGYLRLQPPQVVLEVLMLGGHAKRVATVGTPSAPMMEEDEDEDPPEGEGPWVE